MSVLVLGLGAAIWLHTRRRPVRNGQGSRSSWGLGALFALGLVLVSRQIPAWTCDIGRFDEVLRSCVTVHTRTDPHSAVALKDGLIAFGVLGGTAIAVMSRWVRLSAPVAAIAWMVGAGWLLLDAFVRG